MKNIYIMSFMFVITILSANEYDKKIILKNGFNNLTNKTVNWNTINLYSSSETDSNGEEIELEPLSLNYKGENLIRRAEIIFFGSLTFSTFLGWLMFSAYNSIMYEDTFGKLKRYQFLTLYLGGGVIAFSVSLSDLFIRLKPYFKRVEFY